MRQTSKLFLSEIENLKLRFINEDSEDIESEGYSDRGRNTKRSMGSDEDTTKRNLEKML
jgi:hypothetical protein